jgi:hypothetical protein
MSSKIASTPQPLQPTRKILVRKTESPDLQTRLIDLGFEFNEVGALINPDPQANIQQITLAHDSIDVRKWNVLIVQARRLDQVEADLQSLGLCQAEDVITDQQKEAELERDLRLAVRYYTEAIQPYLKDPMRDLVEWYIADDAYHRLRGAIDKARKWNDWTKEGKQFPVPNEAFPDLATEEFRLPELIGDNEDLKKEFQTLQAPAGSSPAQAIEYALELQAKLKSLPKRPVEFSDEYDLFLSPINFEQIINSNETEGRLPLLPPVPGEPKRFSKEAIRLIVANWQTRRQAPIDEHVACDRIPLAYLCKLRQERFRVHGHVPAKPKPDKSLDTKTQTAKEYYTSLKSAAAYVGTTPRTISNWKKRGWLKAEQLGKKIRIARVDLDKCKSRDLH